MQRPMGAWMFLLFTACASRSVVKPPAAPAAPRTPALAEFVAEARKMGMVYETPPGYAEIPVRANGDQAYDYAVVSADKRIEIRFALRGYQRLPEPIRNRNGSFMFFMTGVANLTGVGHDGKIVGTESLPPAHFNADDVRIVTVRWFRRDFGREAFGEGYEICSAVFVHREQIGDVYTFFLFRDPAAVSALSEEATHALHFAPR